MALIADVAPPGASDNFLALVMLAAVLSPILFGLMILGAAHIHRNRDRRSSEKRP